MPTIGPIGTLESILDFVRFTRAISSGPFVYAALKIVWMYHNSPAPTLGFLGSQSGISFPALVAVIQFSIRVGGPDNQRIGTGHSSLTYLKRFPINILKIDKAFVRDITVNVDDAAIARAIITMAHSLGMKTVAEGVETREQLDFLRTQGCDFAQSYYFSPPLPGHEIERLLKVNLPLNSKFAMDEMISTEF